MKTFRSLWLIGVCLVAQVADARITPARFRAWVDGYYQNPQGLPKDEIPKAASLRYVFVGGIFNEAVKSMFVENVRALVRLGVPERRIQTVFPSSLLSIEENFAVVREKIVRFAAEGPEKLVLIGHSKGAAEALAAALALPAPLVDRVHAVFLLQGAFHGSPLADYFFDDGKAVDDRFPWHYRRAFEFAREAKLVEKLDAIQEIFKFRIDRGLMSLTRRKAEGFWSRHLVTHAKAASKLSDRIYYLASWEHPEKLSYVFHASGLYEALYYGPNDGIVVTDDQALDELGGTLAVYRVGHGDLVTDSNKTSHSHRLKVAIMTALVLGAATEL